MCSALACVPMFLTRESLAALLLVGHPENCFVEMVIANGRKKVLIQKMGRRLLWEIIMLLCL